MHQVLGIDLAQSRMIGSVSLLVNEDSQNKISEIPGNKRKHVTKERDEQK